MRRAPVVLLATAAATAAVVSFHPQRSAVPVATEPKITTTGQTKTTGSSSGSSTAKGQRTVTGAVESTQYGPVQVQVAVSGGRITDVRAVQLPGADNPRSSQISAFAGPQLRQEALTAQSASVHVVSGATYTSQGYQASLQSALSQVGL
jgi:uncharacterized protein with FMN-binding domain